MVQYSGLLAAVTNTMKTTTKSKIKWGKTLWYKMTWDRMCWEMDNNPAWRLPTVAELEEAYQNRTPGFKTDRPYWASGGSPDEPPRSMDFTRKRGWASKTAGWSSRHSENYVRLIRDLP